LIKNVLEEVHKKISEEKSFPFWELLEKNESAMKNLETQILGKIEQNVIVEGKLFLGKNSVIKAGSRIEGNVYIGENCIIGPNAYLRSNVLIDSDCFIGTTEIKNSIILSATKIPHFSYVGDSIIGRNCNLGAGTKIANLRHDNGNVKVMLSGKKIDSGKRKLGALLFDNVKTGVNSCINCGAIVEKDSKILPLEFRK